MKGGPSALHLEERPTPEPCPDALLRGMLNPFTNRKASPVLLKPNAAGKIIIDVA